MTNNLCVTILAAGKGTRMKHPLNIPKILCHYNNKPMLINILEQVVMLKPVQIIIVIQEHQEIINSMIKQYFPLVTNIIFAIQKQLLGTADAVKSTLYFFNDTNYDNMILNADTPLLKHITLKTIYDYYINNNNKLLITGINKDDPTNYGRIVTFDNPTKCEYIIEEKDCGIKEKSTKLINVGIYICDTNILKNIIPLINNNNKQKECYLTDMASKYKEKYNESANLFTLSNSHQMEIFNVNTIDDLNFIQLYNM